MAEKQRILIVDDDYNIAELISLYLTKECFETKIVGDGEEALRVFPEFQPNLILLDLMLPGIDGYQVCRELRSTSQVPIIMLSAKGEIFDKVLGLELGADDYVTKPFRFERVGCQSQSRSAALPAAGADACIVRDRTAWQFCRISGSHRQPDELLRHLQRTLDRAAAEGTGTALFPRVLTKPGIHKGATSRPYLGI